MNFELFWSRGRQMWGMRHVPTGRIHFSRNLIAVTSPVAEPYRVIGER